MNTKSLLLLTIYVLCSSLGVAQKHDNNWIFSSVGTTENEPFHEQPFGSNFLNFSEATKRFIQNESPINVGLGGLAMSDSIGNLLFYTNGLQIINKEDEIMPNGRGLTPSVFANQVLGYLALQSVICLPDGKEENLYHLYIQQLDSRGGEFPQIYSILKTTIDMDLDNGKGDVTEKNVLVYGNKESVSDTTYGIFSAVRHGNGRDWWMVFPDRNRNKIYRFVITPDGIEEEKEQFFEILPETGESLSMGQAKFSPNGERYAFQELNSSSIHLFKFDRCSGLLFDHQVLDYEEPEFEGFAIEFSPNSNFLYYGDLLHLMQLDLEESNPIASVDTIAFYDDFKSRFGHSYAFMQITPDNKIIIAPPNGEKNLTVINAPDKKGKECEVILHGIQSFNLQSIHIPYYPNYRLYDLQSSPCDTLGIDR